MPLGCRCDSKKASLGLVTNGCTSIKPSLASARRISNVGKAGCGWPSDSRDTWVCNALAHKGRSGWWLQTQTQSRTSVVHKFRSRPGRSRSGCNVIPSTMASEDDMSMSMTHSPCVTPLQVDGNLMTRTRCTLSEDGGSSAITDNLQTASKRRALIL